MRANNPDLDTSKKLNQQPPAVLERALQAMVRAPLKLHVSNDAAKEGNIFAKFCSEQ